MTAFSALGLAEPLLKALADEGYATPTPIQAQAIPTVIAGRDLLGIAQTGTGKTAAFALPILHRLAADRRPAPRKGCRALVLSPTRELATQIADSFRAYGRHMGMTVAVVFGGVGHRPQVQALARGIDVLVATPGRLLDHMGARDAVLSGTEILVLDEADQMLDLGFVKPIRDIVSKLPMRRQNLFFSATMPREIAALADEMLRDPAKVAVAPVATTAERVAQRVIHVEAAKKRALLTELLSDAAMERTLVFTRTKRGADRVARHLEVAGIEAAAIHGNKSQRQREAALESFRRSEVRVLVATDIAARGIDIDLVTHVVNYELPEVPEAYVHRIGRTARAGASGIAISLCDGEERDLLRAIERLTRQPIEAEDRRGDTSLAADVRSAKSAGRDRSEREHASRREPHGSRREQHGARRERQGREAPRRNSHHEESHEHRRREHGHREAAHDGRRSEGRRPEGHRSEGHRPEGHRPDGHRPEGRRHDGQRANAHQRDNPRHADGPRQREERRDGHRGGPRHQPSDRNRAAKGKQQHAEPSHRERRPQPAAAGSGGGGHELSAVGFMGATRRGGDERRRHPSRANERPRGA